VAHDFNNMLGVIMGYSEMALSQIGADNPLYDNLNEIFKAAKRSGNLTRQLLAFARKQVVTPKVLDLNDTVEGMIKMLKRLIGEDIDLVWKPGPVAWSVRMDPAQIDQIMVNLCVNARDAIDGVGTITIETGQKAFTDAHGASHPGFRPGEFLLMSISDDGQGMDKAILDKIFEPFFTTKERGKGTGLGLATVYGIVKQNNGFIYVYSEPGCGTTFRIYLPRHIAAQTQAGTKIVERTIFHGHETILLVEDDATILKITTLMLKKLGYRVLAAATPGEAIRIANTHKEAIDLLIADVVMPEMNGVDLANRLHSLRPAIRHLYMSGYTDDFSVVRGILDEGVHFIQKPFSIQDIADKVAEVLGKN
jgi:CheY-like chemotaxis protein